VVRDLNIGYLTITASPVAQVLPAHGLSDVCEP
jgi:hypothetical protein